MTDTNANKVNRFPVNHTVKSHPEPFSKVWSGEKGHEIRINDRHYRVGHSVRLMEFDPDTKDFSGRTIDLIIMHLRHADGEGPVTSAGLKPGYVVFDFLIVNQWKKGGEFRPFSEEIK